MRRLQAPTADALRAALASAMRRSGELRSLHRLHAVLLVSLGHSCYEVAHWFGENPRSVERWLHAFDRQGPQGLQECSHPGRPSRLSQQALRELALDLAAQPGACGYVQTRWSGKLLARHLERNYAVCLSLRHCQRLLQRSRH